jgi:peptidoglycan/LPS O-acetylase OafA/YrhL
VASVANEITAHPLLRPASASGRIPALDGIRGLAIGLVLLWHGFFGALTALPNHPLASRVIALGRLSWSGVDLFFVLSGFLIGGILLDAADSPRYFVPFYMRRVHRILPLYAVTLAFVFLLPLVALVTEPTRIPLGYYLGFAQNFWMAKHGNFGGGALGVTWSLAIEEQFYITLPVLIRYVSRARLWWIVAIMIAGAPLLRLALHSPFASYVLMPCRMDALGFGLAAALIVRDPELHDAVRRGRNFVHLALAATLVAVMGLLASGFQAFSNQIFGLEYSLLALLYFLLLLTVLINGGFETAFSHPLLRYLGLIAYGLYLLHFLCIDGVHAVVLRMRPGQSGWLVLAVSSVGISLAIALASLSWKYLEKPLIRRGHRFQYRERASAPLPR